MEAAPMTSRIFHDIGTVFIKGRKMGLSRVHFALFGDSKET
jgi:hypothetical protein